MVYFNYLQATANGTLRIFLHYSSSYLVIYICNTESTQRFTHDVGYVVRKTFIVCVVALIFPSVYSRTVVNRLSFVKFFITIEHTSHVGNVL